MDIGTIFICIVALAANFFAWHMLDKTSKAKDKALVSMSEDFRRIKRYVDNLDDERRTQHEAMTEVFDFLNDNQPFLDQHGRKIEGLGQCRGVLIHALQNSTYGRGK